MKGDCITNKNHSRMFLSAVSSLVKAVETPDTDTRGWTKVLSKNTSARHHNETSQHDTDSVALKGFCSGPQPLSKQRGAEQKRLSTTPIKICRSLHRHPAVS